MLHDPKGILCNFVYYFFFIFYLLILFAYAVKYRVQSLEKSSTQLPDSLLLIEKSENGRQVIGHSRLTRVLEDPYGCWIGSGLYILQSTYKIIIINFYSDL